MRGLIWYGVSILWSCLKCNAWRFSLQNLQESADFFEFLIDRFIATFGVELAPKNFWVKVHDWLKKRNFLIVNLFLHFNRMDAQQRVSFILVLARQHPVNLNFFQLKRTPVAFLFICLFIHFVCDLVWNVFVNQMRFLHLTELLNFECC